MLTQTAPRLIIHPKNVVPRTQQLGIAHDLAKRCGYETRVDKPGRGRYEDFLQRTVGVRTLAKASREQRNTVIGVLEAQYERIVNASSLDELLA